MTADEAREVEGMFGCIEGLCEKHKYKVKFYGTIFFVTSYTMLFETTVDNSVVSFSLRNVEKFSVRIPGKRMIRLPKLYKRNIPNLPFYFRFKASMPVDNTII